MPTKIVVPELGESVMEATVLRWHKKEGERVNRGEVLLELETEKVNMEVVSENAGVLTQIAHPAGTDVKIGEVLGVIDETASETAPHQPVQPSKSQSAPPRPQKMAVGERAEKETPEVEKAVPDTEADRQREVAQKAAEGKRVQEQQAVVEPAPVRPAVPAEDLGAEEPAPAPAPPSRVGREERLRMTRRRRTIARRMLEAKQSTAMLTTFNEVDMSALMELRKKHRDDFHVRTGQKLGLLSFFLKATAAALKEFPLLNAEIQEDDILIKHYYDIAVAMDTPEGLVVPVLRDVDRMSFADIERTIVELSQKALNDELSLQDLRGGGFTITNGGVFGSLLSTPILNPPQVGILGMHRIQDRPVAVGGQVLIRPMMYVALSYDHRIIDGRDAVQFLVRVKQYIEEPAALLLQG